MTRPRPLGTEDDPRVRVAIVGSCVSRDTFEFLDQRRFELVKYVARQSLISSYSRPAAITDTDLTRLRSDFQRRTVRADHSSSLAHDLLSLGDSVDLVLWDLTDERFGVWDLGAGQFVTRSVELIASGLDESIAQRARLVPFGSRRHLSLWAHAVPRFASTLRQTSLSRPPLLLAPPWATTDERGREVEAALVPEPLTARRIVRRYLKRAGEVPTISIPASRVVASSEHRWGAAPYHYTDDVYLEMADHITRWVEATSATQAARRP